LILDKLKYLGGESGWVLGSVGSGDHITHNDNNTTGLLTFASSSCKKNNYTLKMRLLPACIKHQYSNSSCLSPERKFKASIQIKNKNIQLGLS